jgi:hypothetical protein
MTFSPSAVDVFDAIVAQCRFSDAPFKIDAIGMGMKTQKLGIVSPEFVIIIATRKSALHLEHI